MPISAKIMPKIGCQWCQCYKTFFDKIYAAIGLFLLFFLLKILF